MRRVLRYEIPIDDEWHPFAFPIPRFAVDPPPVLHVASRRVDVVEAWVEVDDSHGEEMLVLWRVFGTGQPIEGTWRGTCLSEEIPERIEPGFARGPLKRGAFVWHLYEEDR